MVGAVGQTMTVPTFLREVAAITSPVGVPHIETLVVEIKSSSGSCLRRRVGLMLHLQKIPLSSQPKRSIIKR